MADGACTQQLAAHTPAVTCLHLTCRLLPHPAPPAALMMGVGGGTTNLATLRLAGVAGMVGGALSMAVSCPGRQHSLVWMWAVPSCPQRTVATALCRLPTAQPPSPRLPSTWRPDPSAARRACGQPAVNSSPPTDCGWALTARL